MNGEPSFVVEWEIETRYLTGREKNTQYTTVPSMQDAQEVASNIREDASFKDVNLGQIWNYVNYIRVYKLSDPVEL